MNDETEFKRDRGVWGVATAAVAGAIAFHGIFIEGAFPELARLEVAGQRQLTFLRALVAVGGVAGGLLAGWRFRFDRYPKTLANAFRGCAIVGVLALLAQSWELLLFTAVIGGVALGWLWVTLIAGLRSSMGTVRLGLCVGLGAGLGLGLAELPWLTEANATMQTVLATVVVGLTGVSMPWMLPQEPSVSRTSDYQPGVVVAVTTAFIALVWIESASGLVITNAQMAHGAEGSWLRAGSCLVAGLLAGCALDRRWQAGTALGALLLLALACLLMLTSPLRVFGAGMLQAAGATLLAAALVYYPARGGRVWHTAGFIALTWWVAPMLGIGMAEELNLVPWPFVVATGLVVAGAMAWREHRRRTSA